MSGGRVTPSIPDGKEHDCAVSEVAREALVSSPPHRDGARSVDVCLCARRLRIRMGFLCSIRSHAHTRTHTHTHTHTHTLYRRRCGRSVRLAQRLPTLPKALHTHPSPDTHTRTHTHTVSQAVRTECSACPETAHPTQSPPHTPQPSHTHTHTRARAAESSCQRSLHKSHAVLTHASRHAAIPATMDEPRTNICPRASQLVVSFAEKSLLRRRTTKSAGIARGSLSRVRHTVSRMRHAALPASSTGNSAEPLRT